MYFVMLHHPSVDVPAIPLLNPDANDGGDIAFFENEEDAFSAAENSAFGEIYGYDVFVIGGGI